MMPIQPHMHTAYGSRPDMTILHSYGRDSNPVWTEESDLLRYTDDR